MPKPTTRHARKTRPGPTPRPPETLLSNRVNIGLDEATFVKACNAAYALHCSIGEYIAELIRKDNGE